MVMRNEVDAMPVPKYNLLIFIDLY